jgi:hypothetical protein
VTYPFAKKNLEHNHLDAGVTAYDDDELYLRASASDSLIPSCTPLTQAPPRMPPPPTSPRTWLSRTTLPPPPASTLHRTPEVDNNGGPRTHYTHSSLVTH